jgi:hypothetical protein
LIRARKRARLPRGCGRAVGRRRPTAAGSRIAPVRSAGVIRAPSGGSLRVGSWPRHASALPPAPGRWRRPRQSGGIRVKREPRRLREAERGPGSRGEPRRQGARGCGADDAAIGDEGDHPHHASAAGTDERIDLVHPANELGPSAAKGGQRGGRAGRRRRRDTTGPHGAPLNPMGVPPGPES